ncbi:hypothetical protein OIU76_002652 [Salix suchowensis]|nr:hypothetical protein OIU76_002652 [Salix suchowensis]
MDSANSGSMQSSSGGDEEYASRADSISAFLNSNNKNNPLSHVGPMPNHQLPEPEHHHHSSSSSTMLFDPLSNYFDPFAPSPSSRSALQTLTNPNSLHNLDMVWSKSLRSDTNCTDLGGFISSSSPTQQLTNQIQNRTTFQSLPSHGQESARRGSVSGTNDQVSSTAGIRNPKKRPRASRRAPTTVLSTDTTNFRAMVQEFTGIPAPPFTSSPFPRSRLDLFGTAASALRSAVSHHLDSSPPLYLLRPFAKNVQPPPPPAPPFVSSGLSKQPHNLLSFNVQNPILNFQPTSPSPAQIPTCRFTQYSWHHKTTTGVLFRNSFKCITPESGCCRKVRAEPWPC